MVDGLLPNHREMIQRVTEHFQADPRYLALIIGGSVAKRRALPDSDLDIMLIVSADELAQRSARQTDHFTMMRVIATYPVHEQQAKIRSFGGQVAIWSWYVPEAE